MITTLGAEQRQSSAHSSLIAAVADLLIDRQSLVEGFLSSGEIAQNVTGVAQAARGTTEGASDTKTSADELAKMAAELQQLVGQFKY